MKHRLRIALLFVFVLGIVGFQSRTQAIADDNSGRLPRALSSRSKSLQTETNDWEQTPVDPYIAGAISLVLDSANLPHISYHVREEYGQIAPTWKYAMKEGGSWLTESVKLSTHSQTEYSSSLVLDEDDSPHIVFGSINPEQPYPMIITHAFKQTGAWQFEEVEVIEGACIATPAFTLLSDSSGGLHLFYLVPMPHDDGCHAVLKYARREGVNSWQVSTLVEEVWSQPSIVVDRDDNFHIAYTSYGETSFLHYSKFGSVAEFSPTIVFEEEEGHGIGTPSISLDSSNSAHIAFAGDAANYSGKLYIAHQEQVGWSIEGPIKSLGLLQDADSFFDMEGNLHVFVADYHWGGIYGSRTAVEHYYKTQDGWQEEELGGASRTSFALDSYGNIHGATGGYSLNYFYKSSNPPTYSVSGRITTQSGNPIPGVVVSTATGSSTTDADGNYTITDLSVGTYNVNATLPGYSFTPSARSVSVPPDATSQDFVGIPGAMTDTDGDGLLDDWEINGYDHDNDGIVDVNLPEMGANAFKPDIFVEVDWMEGHRPEDEAIRKIVGSFANAPVYDEADNQIGTGIRLHVDVGPESTDYVTGKLWGDNGKGNLVGGIDEIIVLPDNEDLSPINPIITNEINRSEARKYIFHYSLWISWLKYKEDYYSGYSAAKTHSEPIFVVALGGGANSRGSISEQAGTFMHELGHNLGLSHGGGQGNLVNYKPNYLSVMNYSFQHGGLIINGVDGCDQCFDYSRFEFPPLNEAGLYEILGLNGQSETSLYGTKFRRSDPWLCQPLGTIGDFSLVQANANSNVDWSCNGLIDPSSVRRDVNGDGGDAQTLAGYNDWLNLDFNYAHRYLRPQLGAQAMHLRSDKIEVMDQSLGFEELSLEEARTIPRISETRAQMTASANHSSVAPLDTLTYTVAVYTVDLGTIESFVSTVSLPDGFSYIPDSTTGYITANPVISGNQLTWPSIEIPDATTPREFSFQVRVGTIEGVFSTDFGGTSSTGLVVPDQVEVRVQPEPLERLLLPIIVR